MDKSLESGGNISPDYNYFVAYIYSILLYCNLQWPSAVKNLTIDNYDDGTMVDVGQEQHYVVRVRQHKTAHMLGSAKIVVGKVY